MNDATYEEIEIGARVKHLVLGEGSVLHTEKSRHELLGFFRVHVKFDQSSDANMWVADDELEVLPYNSPPEAVAAT